MKRQDYYNYIRKKLATLTAEIKIGGKSNVLDLNILSENFFVEFCNLLYEYNLKNCNKEYQNFPGIDLIDEKNKIIIQVTSNGTKKKVKDTLEKKVLENLKEYNLKFIFILENVNDLKNKKYSNTYNINFNPKKDIIDMGDILKEIQDKDLKDQEKIFKFIKKELDKDGTTNQILELNEFIKINDKNETKSPLNLKFLGRSNEIEDLKDKIENSKVILVSGNSGVGKTKLVLEVCKIYKNNNWKIYCVHNNGLELYNDLKYLFIEGKYILFIDDANETRNVKSILDFILNLDKEIEVKIILTYRNYVKKELEKIIKEFFCSSASKLKINRLSNDEIKEILKENFNIKNDSYLEKIIEISKGNPRLAVMAGKISIEKSYYSLMNVEKLYENYYGRILEKFEYKTINLLFIISFFRFLKIEDEELDKEIFKEFGLENINKKEIIKELEELNNLEIVDFYGNIVAQISDQSLKDYVLKYSLIDKKIISIFNLLEMFFPKYKNKCLNALNTITNLFCSKNTENYIKNQVKKSWDLEKNKDSNDYLENFWLLDEKKSILIIKNRIEKIVKIEKKLNINVKFSKNNCLNEIFELDMLGEFKNTKYFPKEILKLFFLYFDKRPDLISKFYDIFDNNFFYDEKTINNNFKKEIKVFNEIKNYINLAEETNRNILILQIFKSMLKNEYQTFKEITSKKVIVTIFKPSDSLGNKKLRILIWKNLSILYKNYNYQEFIEEMILDISFGNKEIFQWDLLCLKKYFGGYVLKSKKKLSLIQILIIEKIKNKLEHYNLVEEDILSLYEKNNKLKFLRDLKISYRSSKELPSRLKIKKTVNNYNEKDFSELFKFCKVIKSEKKFHNYELCNGIKIMFEILEEDLVKYLNIVKLYLKEGAPYYINIDQSIEILLKNLSVDKVENILTSNDYDNKSFWISKFYEKLTEKELNNLNLEKMLIFIKNELNSKKECIPKLEYLIKYKKIDSNIINKVSGLLIEKLTGTNKDLYLLRIFWTDYFIDDKGKRKEQLLNIFECCIDNLEKLYLLSITETLDYDLHLLKLLVFNNSEFFKNYILKIYNSKDNLEDLNLYKIWEWDNYLEFIKISYSIIDKNKYNKKEEYISLIFGDINNKSQKIKRRKQCFIKNLIEKNYKDYKEIEKIFYIIRNFIFKDIIEYLLIFLEKNNNIQDFKRISLLPDSQTFSSMPDHIQKKINFYKKLFEKIDENLEKLDYLEHKLIIEESIEYYKNKKEKEIINEKIDY